MFPMKWVSKTFFRWKDWSFLMLSLTCASTNTQKALPYRQGEYLTCHVDDDDDDYDGDNGDDRPTNSL